MTSRKPYVAALAALLISTGAAAFDITESMLNQFIATKLAEKKYSDLHLASLQVSLLEGYASFCAVARPQIYPRQISFCANLTPKWRQDTGSLLATKMSLISLNVPGVDAQQTELVKLLANQSLLPALEGIEIYRAETPIEKQVSSVKISPGKLQLDL
ncbi:MAG: hypothetical protein H6R17_4092 [Proteobacteria bacterium]|nr:hypothetical protein [Pseudomonadota bacterium]